MSPGFTPRPWLSARGIDRTRAPLVSRVAGVHAPALVERARRVRSAQRMPGVAGVHAPALVERASSGPASGRPSSVAGVHAPALVERATLISGSIREAGVAGVHAPALVERSCAPACARGSITCRRGSRPGLG